MLAWAVRTLSDGKGADGAYLVCVDLAVLVTEHSPSPGLRAQRDAGRSVLPLLDFAVDLSFISFFFLS